MKKLILIIGILGLAVAAGIWGQALPGTAQLATGSVSAPYFTLGGTTVGPTFALSAPPSSGWTWANQGSSTVTAVSGSLQFDILPNLGNTNIRAYMRSLPASTGYTAILGFVTPSLDVAACISDGTKYVALFQHNASTYHYDLWNSTTSVNTSTSKDSGLTGPVIWIRFQDAGGTRTISASSNGINWRTVQANTTATFLTETQFGVCYFLDQVPDGIVTLLSLTSSTP